MWIFLSFLTAVCESLKDVLSKNNLKKIDEYSAALIIRLSFIFLLPLLFIYKIPHLNSQFFLALLAQTPLAIVTSILYMKTLKSSDISLSIPLLTFSPLFLLLISPLMVKEFPPLLGIVGVLLIVFGAYFLNIQAKHEGLLAPFKILLKEKGARYMLMIAFLWAIGSNLDKIGTINSSPIFWPIALNFCSSVVLTVFCLGRKKALKNLPENLKVFLPVSIITALGFVSQVTALSMAYVSYVVSITRMSVLISIVLGVVIFKEKGFKVRLIGGTIMVSGVFFIAFSK